MLKPSEFTAGILEAAEHLTLLLPCTTYEQSALGFVAEGKKMAFFLDGDERVRYRIIECQNEPGMSGVLIPNVEIEVDHSSITDLDGIYAKRGSLIRYGESLAVQTAYLGSNMPHQGGPMILISGLPKCDSNQRACFSKWQIVLGQGQEKRVLHTVDLTQIEP